MHRSAGLIGHIGQVVINLVEGFFRVPTQLMFLYIGLYRNLGIAIDKVASDRDEVRGPLAFVESVFKLELDSRLRGMSTVLIG